MKTEMIKVPVSPEEKQHIEAAAKARGISTAMFVRNACLIAWTDDACQSEGARLLALPHGKRATVTASVLAAVIRDNLQPWNVGTNLPSLWLNCAQHVMAAIENGDIGRSTIVPNPGIAIPMPKGAAVPPRSDAASALLSDAVSALLCNPVFNMWIDDRVLQLLKSKDASP